MLENEHTGIEAVLKPSMELFSSFNEEDESRFRVIACDVVSDPDNQIETNSFGNVVISGDNLDDLSMNVPRKVFLTPSPSRKYKDGYVARIPVDPIPENSKEQWMFLQTLISESEVNAFKQVYDSENDKIIDIINNQSEQVKIVKHVIGYREKKLEKLRTKIRDREEYARTYILLEKYDMSDNMIQRIYRKYQDEHEIKKILKKNIYKFTDVNGIGFKKIDEIYLTLDGSSKEDEHRIASGLYYYLEENQKNGNTRIDARKLVQGTTELLGISSKLIRDSLKDKSIVIKPSDIYNVGEILDSNNEDNINKNIVLFNDMYSTRFSFFTEWSLFDTLVERSKTKPHLIRHDMQDMIDRFEEDEGFALSDEQSKFFLDMFESSVSFLSGNAGSGKCLTNSTMIPTPNGFVRNGDLKVGSYVFDRLGNKTKILGVYPQGMKKVFKVILSDGREVLCNDEHIWTTFTSRGNFKDRTVREMLDLGLFATDDRPRKDGTKRRTSKFSIPANECVDYEEKELGLDPYLLGALIANGYLRGRTIEFSSADEFTINKIAKKLNSDLVDYASSNYTWKFRDGKGIVKTKDIVPESLMVTSKYKHIPREYLESSKEQRLELLKGLMDNDGSISVAPRYNCSYSTISPQLRDDVLELVRSLGYKATVSIDDRVGTKHYKNISYEIHILIPNSEKHNLFSLPRKLERVKEAQLLKEKNRRYDRVEISDIIDMGYEEEMTCIMVDNDEHLYLCNDFVVTHNTTSQKLMLQYAKETGQSIVFLAPTGRARKKLAEYTGHTAHTIHSFVGSMLSEMKYNIYFVDESSMVDVVLAMKLLDVVPENSKIVFAGDDSQIPSVAYGNFLYDCLNNNTTFVNKYTKIFRQSEGGILDIVTKIRQGISFIPNIFRERKVFGKDCVVDLRRPESGQDITDQAVKAYQNVLATNKYKVDDIVILSPTKKGKKGTTTVNNKIQSIVNPNDGTLEEFESMSNGIDVIFREGDLVMNQKNHKELQTYIQIGNVFAEDASSISIVNGDIGTIVGIVNQRDFYVKFDEGIVQFKKSDFTNGMIIHGWCITGHKSQGSEYKVVICMVDSSSSFQMNGNLLYTMGSRAKELLLFLGDSVTINRALKKFENLERETNLINFFKIHDELMELKGK